MHLFLLAANKLLCFEIVFTIIMIFANNQAPQTQNI